MSYPVLITPQGTSFLLKGTVKDSKTGNPLDLTGAIGKCLVKKLLSDSDKHAVITKTTAGGGITVENPASGIFFVNFDGQDTEKLSVNQRAKFFCQSAIQLSNLKLVRGPVFYLDVRQGTIVTFSDVVDPDVPQVIEVVTVGFQTITTTDTLAAGDFVNVYNSGSGDRVRKAIATGFASQAHGFVLAGASIGTGADVYFSGLNSSVSGVSPGSQYLSASIAGTATVIPPSTSGNIVQRIGVGTSSTSIYFDSSEPILLA